MTVITRHPLFHDPAYPSSETLDGEQKALVVEFNRRAQTGELAFITPPQCLCGGTEFDQVATYDRYRIWQPVSLCRHCGLMACRPRMANDTIAWFYGSDVYRRLYNSDRMLPHTPDKFLARAESMSWRRDTIKTSVDYDRVERVGEIGCGAGWNLWAFHQDGKSVVGVDYSPELTAAGRAMGMDIRQGTMEALAGERFDVLILSHVLEHMPDPAEALAQGAELLAENGVFYIEVPDARDICLGMFQSAHVWYFTPTRLRHLAASVGLEAIAEKSYGGVHFGLTFRRATKVETPALAGEYEVMRGIIRRFERREMVKDWLRRLGLFDLGRRFYRLLRR